MSHLREPLSLPDENPIRFYDASNTNYVAWKAPSSLSASSVFTMPSAPPASTAFLKFSSTGIASLDTTTYVAGAANNVTEVNSAVLILSNATGAVLQPLTIEAKAASASQGGYVTTGAQVIAGNKTFNGQLYQANLSSNLSGVSGTAPLFSGATTADGQSCIVTFGSDAIFFIIEIGTVRRGIFCGTDYSSATINPLMDLGGLLLLVDFGVGVFVSKSANSNSVTIKNRLGASRVIRVTALSCEITTITAWS